MEKRWKGSKLVKPSVTLTNLEYGYIEEDEDVPEDETLSEDEIMERVIQSLENEEEKENVVYIDKNGKVYSNKPGLADGRKIEILCFCSGKK